MRIALKLGIALLVLLVLAQAALWFAAARWFSGLAQQVEPYASLEYRSSYAWLTGRAGIRDVTIRPRLGNGETAVSERIELRTTNLASLVGLLWSGVDAWPDQLDLVLHRLHLTAGLEQDLRDRAATLGYFAPFEAMGCNGRGRFGGADYAELGWLQTHTQLTLGVRKDRRRDSVFLQLVHDQDPLARMQLELELLGLNAAGDAVLASLPSLRLQRFRAAYSDRGLIGQRNAYCAARLSLTAPTFVELHMDAVREEMEARGIFLAPAVYQTYQDFAEQGGSLEFTIFPQSGLPLSRLGSYAPEQRLTLLNAGLSHNQGTQVPVTARFYTEGVDRDVRVAPDASDAVRIRASADHADRIEFEELEGLIGRRLLIRTRAGVGHVGILLGTQGSLIRIEVERGGRGQRMVIAQESVAEMRLAY